MDLKQRVTLAGDEMCVYLDGIAVDKPIDIFESFGMGRGGGWGGALPLRVSMVPVVPYEKRDG